MAIAQNNQPFSLPSGTPEMQPRWKTPFGGTISQNTGETLQGISQVLMRGGYALLGLGLAQSSGQPGLAPVVAGIGGGIADVMQKRWWTKEAEYFDEKYTKPYSQMVQAAYQRFAASTSPVTITKDLQIPDKEGKTVTKTVPITGFPLSRDPTTGQVTDVVPANSREGIQYYMQASQEMNSTIANSTIQYLDSTSLPMFRDNPFVSQKAQAIHQQFTKWTGQVTGAFSQQMELTTELGKQEKYAAETENIQYKTAVLDPLRAQTELTKQQANLAKARNPGGRGRGKGSSKIDPRTLQSPSDLYNYILTDKNEIASTQAIIKGFGYGSDSKLDDVVPGSEIYGVDDKGKKVLVGHKTYREARSQLYIEANNEKLRVYLARNLNISPVQSEEIIYRDPTTRNISILYRLQNAYPMVPEQFILDVWKRTNGDVEMTQQVLEETVAQDAAKEQAAAATNTPKKGLLERLDEWRQEHKIKE